MRRLKLSPELVLKWVYITAGKASLEPLVLFKPFMQFSKFLLTNPVVDLDNKSYNMLIGNQLPKDY